MKSLMEAVGTFILCTVMLHASARADDPCIKGKEALAKGDYISAIKFLREGVHDDKKNLECNINLGIALLNADSAELAVQALIPARELDSTNARIYLLMGDAYIKEGIQTAAIEQYQAAAARDTANADIRRKLARAYLKIRSYPEASAEFRKVIILDTTDNEAYRQVGHLYYRASQFEKAAQYLKVVYERNPKDSSRVEYAKALYQANYYQVFIPVGETIFAEDPSQAEIGRWVTNAKRDLKILTVDTTNSMNMFKDTVGLKPHEWMDRGKNAKAVKQDSIAIYSFVRAIELDSALTKEIAYDLGSLYMSAKEWAKAIDMFDKKAALDTSVNFRFACNLNASMALMQLKEWEGSRTHLLNSITYKPEDVRAWQTLAECYMQMDDSTGAARTAYRKMLELINATPENQEKYKKAAVEGYRTEGFYLLIGKKYPPALEMFKEVMKIDPADCQTILWTAQTYALSNLRDDAKKWYCKVLSNKCDKFDADAIKGLTAMGLTKDDCGK